MTENQQHIVDVDGNNTGGEQHDGEENSIFEEVDDDCDVLNNYKGLSQGLKKIDVVSWNFY